MLIYESEGFFEVEEDNILDLYRSTQAKTLTTTGDESFELQALLCRHRTDDAKQCHVGFYCRAIKRSLVFVVKDSAGTDCLQQGLEMLKQLEFQMEAVNLRLSPAMRQVVLRDIPGILPPKQARQQRTERMAMLAELRDAVEEDPEGKEGKKAQAKLDAEERLDEKSKVLREFLNREFAPDDETSGDLRALVSQVEELTARLEKAEAALDKERAQLEMTEGIKAAAEKRIRELEEILVDAETKSAGNVKAKQKIVELESRIAELTEELQAAVKCREEEQLKQEGLVGDVKTAHARSKELEEQLAAEKVRREEFEAEKAELAKRLTAATATADGSAGLEASLQKAERKVASLTNECEGLEAQVTKLQSVEQELEKQLSESQAKVKELEKAKVAAEETAEEAAQSACQVSEAQQQRDAFEQDLAKAREDLDIERSIRQRLEKGAVADQRQIAALEKQLEEGQKAVSETESAEKGATAKRDLEKLETKLDDALARIAEEVETRQELEQELDEAHKLIDALEKALKQAREATPGSSGKARQPESRPADTQLAEKLKTVEAQLEQEQLEQKKLANDFAKAEKRIAELEQQLDEASTRAEQTAAVAGPSVEAAPDKASSSKPLPHELRPPPKKGMTFHPDWDLEGLPCKSAGQVLRAWESAFNVQLSLEGYPSQYCTAFLVLLKMGNQKSLFMLFRLKKNKHTLVCVPAKKPKNEAELKNTIKEGLRFLQLSGFELSEMAPENVAGALQSYFLDA